MKSFSLEAGASARLSRWAKRTSPVAEVDDVGAGGRAEAVVERRQRRAQARAVDGAGGGDEGDEREQRDEREQGETAAHGMRR